MSASGLPQGWRECQLGEVLRIKHGYAFKGAYFSDNGPYIVLTPGNFHEEGGFKLKSKEKYYVGEFPSEYILRRSDLLVAMTEQAQGLLGSTALVPEDGLYLHNQRLGLIAERNQSETDKRFLYYLFKTYNVRAQIQATASGTKVRHTSPSRIYEVKVSLPPLLAQRKIAAVLSAYDDLIENNTRRIAILEEMAQLIYREWFVHFRFPGHEGVEMVESELGPIPEGWEAHKVGQFGEVLTGKTPSKKIPEYYGDYMPFIKIPDMRGRVFCTQTADNLSRAGADSQRKKTLPPDSLCVSCIGSVGLVGITVVPSQTNQQINSVVLRDESDREFLYFALRGLEETISRYGATGATMANLSRGKFVDLPVPYPDASTLTAFHEIAYPFFEQIKTLQLKNEILRPTRDLLLSHLVSGEIDVSELEIA